MELFFKRNFNFELFDNCLNFREPCDVHDGSLKVFHLEKQLCLIPAVSCNTTDCCQVLNVKPIPISQKARSFQIGEKISEADKCHQAILDREVELCENSHYDCDDTICTSNKFANANCHKYNYCQVEIGPKLWSLVHSILWILKSQPTSKSTHPAP